MALCLAKWTGSKNIHSCSVASRTHPSTSTQTLQESVCKVLVEKRFIIKRRHWWNVSSAEASEWVPYWAAPCCYLYKSYDIYICVFFLTTTAKKSTIQVLQIIHNGLFLHCIHYSHKGFGRRYLYHTLTFLQRSWAFERSSTWRNEIVPQKWFGSSIGFFFLLPSKKKLVFVEKHSEPWSIYCIVFCQNVIFTQHANVCGVNTIKSNHRKNMQI